MAKFKQIDNTDFDFSKPSLKKESYFFERFVATTFIAGFISLLLLAPTMQQNDLNPIQYEPFYNNPDINHQELSPKYIDYMVTPEDKTMFASMFEYNVEYNNQLSFGKDKNMSSFQAQLRQSDLLNTDILNTRFDNKQKISVKSSILAIEPGDKNSIVQATGNSDLDYVDLVVQKTYSQNKNSYSEQHMVSVSLDKHQIVSMTSNRMID